MPEDRRHARRSGRTAPGSPSPRQRIPLPPLHRGRPAPGATDDPAPAELLVTRAPAADGASPEPHRTGSSGAVILDTLVDEIGQDLDRENGRHDPSAPSAPYRLTLACSSLAPPSPRTPGRNHIAAGFKGR